MLIACNSSDPRRDANAQPITDVHHPRDLKRLEAGAGDGGRWGTGGMTTKLAAARIATASGVTVHLADGRDPARLVGLLEGDRGGHRLSSSSRTPRQPSQLVGPCLGSRGGTLPGPRRLSGSFASWCLFVAGGCDGGEGSVRGKPACAVA